jgi:molybdopterin converting factor small subunit
VRVRILYFAQLREQLGKAEESLETTARTPAAIYRELASKYGLAQPGLGLAVAVDDEIASWDTELRGGETLVFLTPFGGG